MTARRVLTFLGVAVLGYGAGGLLTDGPALGGWLRFWLGSALAHDLLLAPVVLAVGGVVVRVVRGRARAPVQAGAVLTGVLVLIEAPFVLGAGRRADVPSALPLHYGRALLVVLALIWTGVAVAAAVRLRPRAAADHAGAEPDDQ